MLGETTFVLFLVFILIIAVVVLSILYVLHVNKYSETHTFYKNLLSVMKENTKFKEADLDDELVKTDFDVDTLTQQQKDTLTNVLGGSVSNNEYSNIANNMISSAIAEERANNDNSPENIFYKNSYSILSEISKDNSLLSNISSSDFDVKTFKKEYDKTVENLFSNIKLDVQKQGFDWNDNNGNISFNKTLKLSDLNICNDNMANCYNLRVDDDELIIKSGNNSNVIKFGNDDLVIDTQRASNKGVFHKNTFYTIDSGTYDKDSSYGSYSTGGPNTTIVSTFDNIAEQPQDIQNMIYNEQKLIVNNGSQSGSDNPFFYIKTDSILPQYNSSSSGPIASLTLTYNSNNIYVFPYTRIFDFVIQVEDSDSTQHYVKIQNISQSSSPSNSYIITVSEPLGTPVVIPTDFVFELPSGVFSISGTSITGTSITYNPKNKINLLLMKK